MPEPDGELPAPLSAALSQAVDRYWNERAEGRRVSVDDLLETAPGTAEYDHLRARLISTIATQAGVDSNPKMSSNAAPDRSGVSWPVSGGDGPMPEIAGYDLVGCLGRGGMGAVFEGYQQSTGRRVAIKIMLDQFGAAEAARKRFEREVEVVARLQHPGIVSIIDSGVRSGRYFYVLEYVEGRNLDAAFPPGQCDPKRVIVLMAAVCDAVDYAHQHGVLHRDLKPGNILVDDQDVPHLLDFGLAKVFDPEVGDGGSHGQLGLTIDGPGQLLGTVAYMSPEQAEGRHADTNVRTDVYALGVIAYELLSGQLPLSIEGSLRDVLRRIIEIDPVPPSTVRSSLSHDLDAVILKSLEKAPERRYATAGDFAADLRRVLAGEPVLARRIGPAGRTWRWVRRNRAVSAVTAAALVTLIVISTLLVARILRESAIAASERDLARANFERLRIILESADPERSPGGATVLQLLDTATHALDEAPPDNVRAEADIRQVLGSVYRKLGEYGKAGEHQRRVLEIREAAIRRSADPLVAEALHNLAATLWWDGDYRRAEELYSRSLQMRRELHAGDHPAVAFSLTHLAACHLRMGKHAEARKMYEEALAMRQRLYGSEHEEIAQSINNLAKCLLESGDYEDAERLHRGALQMIRRLRGDQFVGTAAASQNLGDCLLRRAMAEQVAGTAVAARSAAEDARDAFELAYDIRSATFPSGHHLIAASMSGLARAELLLDNHARAAELAEGSVEEFRRTRRDDHPDLVMGLKALGLVEFARGSDEHAKKAFEEALRIAAGVRPLDAGMMAELRGLLGEVLARTGETDRAEALLLNSLEAIADLRGTGAVETIVANRRLAEFYRSQNRPEDAARYLPAAQFTGGDAARHRAR